MGYTTEFSGRFSLDRALEANHAAYLRQFAGTRRMRRSESAVATLPDPCRLAVGLSPGPEGGYFVGGGGVAGQEKDASILEYNKPPQGQPGLWCQWVPTEHDDGIEWDGGEKFYHYAEWLQYIIDSFLAPWGYVVEGVVRWEGEEPGDVGHLT